MSIKSEIAKSFGYLRNARTAITECGGAISPTAGLEELYEAIYSVPVDIYVGLRTDDATAYTKAVPDNAKQYALINNIGGVTVKEEETFTAKVIVESDFGKGVMAEVEFIYEPSIPFKLTETDVANNGPWMFTVCCQDQYGNVVWLDGKGITVTDDNGNDYDGLPTGVVMKKISGTAVDEGAMLGGMEKGTEFVCTPAIFNWNEEFTIPCIQYDANVTAIRSHGKNFLTYPYSQNTTKYNKDTKTWENISGVDFKLNDDNTLIANGTTSGECWFDICYDRPNKLPIPCDIPAGKYRLSGGARVGRNKTKIKLILYDENMGEMVTVTNITGITAVSITKPAKYIYCRINIAEDTTLTDVKFSPMLSLSQDSTYSPYREPKTYLIPEEFTAIEGYGKEGFVLDFDTQTSRYEENELPIPGAGYMPLVEVEAGGCLEFMNEYGLAVPSKVTYVVLPKPKPLTPALTLPTPTVDTEENILKIYFDILVDGEVVASVPENEEE